MQFPNNSDTIEKKFAQAWGWLAAPLFVGGIMSAPHNYHSLISAYCPEYFCFIPEQRDLFPGRHIGGLINLWEQIILSKQSSHM